MAVDMDMDVVIVGGGLGGLAVALGLQERGIRAEVFEKAPKVRPHSGTALSLAANGLRGLDGVKPGLASRMIKEGAHITHLRAIGRVDGEPAKEVIIPCQPGLMCMIPWKTAQQTLAEEVPDQSTLHWRHTFVDYKAIEGGVEARFEVAVDGEGGQSSVETKVVRAKLLVGADGLWSQVRKILVGPEGDEPRDLYLNTWNALIPTESFRSLNLHQSNEICINHFVSKSKLCYLSDSGCGLTLWQVRGPDVSGEITKAYAADLEAHGPDVRKVRALRQMEDLEDMQHMVEAMKATHPDMVREARQVDRRPLTSWSNSSKTVVLIGDAAHAMYPGPGEGARTSFEDAHQLCNLLQEVFCSSPVASLEDAVTRFEKIRIPRVSKIQAYAAERTYWPEYIPEWAKKLTDAEKAQRSKEYVKWVLQYPECMFGDPESTYWKP
ncbi:hypothetical protein KC19_5G079900 [Ceratodon purpureus]|uniref:FAD-binding domain-containing protein n=1 Tax=Ceratodon purpureus TaxID=3225 RepID=A0A8T0I0I4_CERPU|nr:hypothetical protein KC19_5G079900 [Ceratodon purpureus]